MVPMSPDFQAFMQNAFQAATSAATAAGLVEGRLVAEAFATEAMGGAEETVAAGAAAAEPATSGSATDNTGSNGPTSPYDVVYVDPRVAGAVTSNGLGDVAPPLAAAQVAAFPRGNATDDGIIGQGTAPRTREPPSPPEDMSVKRQRIE